MLVVPAFIADGSAGATTPTTPIAFGMDAASITAQTSAGAKPDYGTFWIGPWTLSSGWGGPDGQLATMKAAGVTPAIHFYYWGDDITPTCVENGCWSSLHNAQKTRAGWESLGTQLTTHLTSKMAGEPVVVFLESEFNKGGISAYEPFDGYMAAMTDKIHAGYPNAIVVLGFGNWDNAKWGNFDRAAAAADMVGLQGMRGSTKDTEAHYNSLYDATLTGVHTLGALFPGKPIMLTDIALSSYPEPAYLQKQADNLGKFFTGTAALKEAGVTAMIYRSWLDAPNMDLANYYGQAERYWGLANGGGAKLAQKVWVDGVNAERTANTNNSPTASFTATASGLAANVDASASSDPDASALSYAWAFGDAAAGTGRTASHTYASAGTYTIRLTVSDGALTATTDKTVTVVQPNRAPVAAFAATVNKLTASMDASGSSDPEGDALSYSWTFGDNTGGSGRTVSHTFVAAGTYTVRLTVSDGSMTGTTTRSVTVTAPPAAFTASFAVAAGSNEWWQEVKVTSSATPAKVEFSANGGAWQSMSLKSWGSWATSVNVVKGTPIVFRATDSAGQTASSTSQPWLGAASPPPAPTFTATFAPKSVGNNWWVEAGVSSSQTIVKVEAKLNGGAFVELPKDSWGTFAKSINAPNGTQVVFRATSSTGATATSATVIWT